MRSHDMRFFRPAGVLLALTAFLFTGPVHSLGLGKLSVLSALDEPLIAEIELTSVEEGALDTLEVKLGNAEDFKQAGIARETFLRTLEFSVVKGGTPRIRISTTFPAREPFLHFLVRANWGDGNLLREYTALLDPPLYAEKQPVAISSPGVLDEARELARPDAASEGTDTMMEVVVVEEEGTAQTSDLSFTGAEYGPIAAGDTLWGIASSLDTRGRDVTVFQVMIALLRENPEAFIDNNINRMMKGQILRLSDPEFVGREEARLAYESQMSDWESFRAMAAQTAGVVKVPAGQEASGAGSSDAPAADEGATDSTMAMSAAESGESAGEEGEGAPPQDDLLKIVRATLEEESESSGTEATQGNTETEPEKEVGMLQEKLATLEESLVSAELQNQELRERVVLLEQQVIKAQRLVELESQELAMAQEQAAQRQEEKMLLEQQLAEMQLTADQAPDNTQDTTASPQSGEQMADAAISEAQDVEKAEASAPEAAESAGTEQPSAMAEEAGIADAAQTAAEPVQQPPATAATEISAAETSATETAEKEQPAAPATKTRVDTREDASSAIVPVADRPGAKPWWQNMIDSVTGSSFNLVAGIVGVLVALAGIILFVRRRRSLAEFEESILSGSGLEGQTDTTDTAANKNTDTSFLSDFGMAGMGNMQADEVDPLAEAEVYLAYGRDEQAEEVLKEAATRTPERHELKLKLLQIYQQRNDLNSFETLAEELYPAGGQGDQAVWSQVVKMGAKMNPDNPLFSQPVGDAVAFASPKAGTPLESSPAVSDAGVDVDLTEKTVETDDPSQSPFPQPDEPVGIDEEFERLAQQMGLSDDAQQGSNASDTENLPEEDSDMLDFAGNERPELDFELDLGGVDEQIDHPTGASQVETASADEEPVFAEDTISSNTNSVDSIELDLPDFPDEPTLEANALAGDDEDDGELTLPSSGSGSDSGAAGDTLVRLDTAEPAGKLPADDGPQDEIVKDVTRNFGVVTGDGSITSDTDDEAEKWDEAATKLDLAQAYLNMGDKAGARSIIDEVMKEGSPAQRDQAAELQSQIG